jgi:hypothetical protein
MLPCHVDLNSPFWAPEEKKILVKFQTPTKYLAWICTHPRAYLWSSYNLLLKPGLHLVTVGSFLKDFFFFGGTGVWTQGSELARQSSAYATLPVLLKDFISISVLCGMYLIIRVLIRLFSSAWLVVYNNHCQHLVNILYMLYIKYKYINML